MRKTWFGASAPYKHFCGAKILAQTEFISVEQDDAGAPAGPWPVGNFITCCEEEKLAKLRAGKAFHIHDGRLVP